MFHRRFEISDRQTIRDREEFTRNWNWVDIVLLELPSIASTLDRLSYEYFLVHGNTDLTGPKEVQSKQTKNYLLIIFRSLSL